MRALLLAALLLPLVAHAQLFKCKDPAGKTTYQETPCADKAVQKKITKDIQADVTGDDAPKPSGRKAMGTDSDRRLPVDRPAPQASIDACIKLRQADLLEEIADFKAGGMLSKRIWLSGGVTAERMLVNVTVRETKQITPRSVNFTCVLRGDDSVDPAATKRFDNGD